MSDEKEGLFENSKSRCLNCVIYADNDVRVMYLSINLSSPIPGTKNVFTKTFDTEKGDDAHRLEYILPNGTSRKFELRMTLLEVE